MARIESSTKCTNPCLPGVQDIELDVLIPETIEEKIVSIARDRKVSPEDLVREVLCEFAKTH